MAKETKSWEANDGSLHKTACEAAKCDLELLVKASPCAENAPYAKILLEWLMRQSAEIVVALNEYDCACPRKTPTEQAPLDSQVGPGQVEPAQTDFEARRDLTLDHMKIIGAPALHWLTGRGLHFDDFIANATISDLEAWDEYRNGTLRLSAPTLMRDGITRWP